MTAGEIRDLARSCGFELAGVAPAEPAADRNRYRAWSAAGFAGEMRYLTDRRGPLRDDPRNLLSSARSIVCVGKAYNTPWPYSTTYGDPELAWISRYAWGADYHDSVRAGLERLDVALRERSGEIYESKICVDTAPLLERSYARMAGLGWIGKNTCVINEGGGSWFFLGELLTSLTIAPDTPPPDRCGTCSRCIDACPTSAIVPSPAGGEGFSVDSRLCISYFTIELRGTIPEERRTGIGGHVFGCDICQDVCPWNRKAAVTDDAEYQPRFRRGGQAGRPLGPPVPPLAWLAEISEEEFRRRFQGTPITRARYSGFLRNVAVAMGNRGLPEFRAPLERLSRSDDSVVAEHARWALERIVNPQNPEPAATVRTPPEPTRDRAAPRPGTTPSIPGSE